jgi:hypothetical protein
MMQIQAGISNLPLGYEAIYHQLAPLTIFSGFCSEAEDPGVPGGAHIGTKEIHISNVAKKMK